MKENQITEILGTEQAQDDPRFHEYSVTRPDLVDKLSNPADGLKIINAARGAGKSALFLILKGTLSTNQHVVIAKYKSDVELPIDELNVNSYVNFWKNQILGWILEEIGSSLTFACDDKKTSAVEYAEKTGKKEKNITYLLDKIKFQGNPIEKTKSDPLIREPEVLRLVNDFKKDFWVFIDEIDNNYENNKKDKNLLAGLFIASQDISRKSSKIKIRVSIRPHIYTILESEYDQIQTLREKEVRIEWKPHQLRTILAKRIKAYLERNKQEKDISSIEDTEESIENSLISVYFDNFDLNFNKSTRHVYNTLATISFFRPRWLIEFCKLAFSQISYGDTVNCDAAKRAMYKYGSNRLKFTAGEHHSIYPGILSILNQFYNKHRVNLGSSANLNNFIKENIIHKGVVPCEGVAIDIKSLEIARSLYMVDFIQAKVKLGEKDYRHYYFWERPDFLTNWDMPNNIKWFIHPAYSNALHIVDDKVYRQGAQLKNKNITKQGRKKRRRRK